MEHYPKSLTAAAVLRKLLSREPVELAAQPLPSLATALAAFVARAPAASTPLALLLAGEAASLTRNVAGSRPSDKRKPEKYIYIILLPLRKRWSLHYTLYSTVRAAGTITAIESWSTVSCWNVQLLTIFVRLSHLTFVDTTANNHADSICSCGLRMNYAASQKARMVRLLNLLVDVHMTEQPHIDSARAHRNRAADRRHD